MNRFLRSVVSACCIAAAVVRAAAAVRTPPLPCNDAEAHSTIMDTLTAIFGHENCRHRGHEFVSFLTCTIAYGVPGFDEVHAEYRYAHNTKPNPTPDRIHVEFMVSSHTSHEVLYFGGQGSYTSDRPGHESVIGACLNDMQYLKEIYDGVFAAKLSSGLPPTVQPTTAHITTGGDATASTTGPISTGRNPTSAPTIDPVFTESPSISATTSPTFSPTAAPSETPSSEAPSCRNSAEIFPTTTDGATGSCDDIASLGQNLKRKLVCRTDGAYSDRCPGLCEKERCACANYEHEFLPRPKARKPVTCDTVHAKLCKRKRVAKNCPGLCDEKCAR